MQFLLNQAQNGDKEAQLALSHYYFERGQNEQMQRWFIPLLEQKYPPALLKKVDYLYQNSPDKSMDFLFELAKRNVPGANYRMAMMLYFHPELAMDFSPFLIKACQAGEISAIIVAASLFFQLNLGEQAKQLLQRNKQDKKIALIIAEMKLTDHIQTERNIDYSLLVKPSGNNYKISQIAPEINLFSVDNFLSEFDCQWLKMRAQKRLKESLVVDGDNGKQIVSEVRTCQYAQIFPTFNDWILLDIELRINALTGIPRVNGEVSNVLYYQKGQEYKAHYDFFHPKDPGSNQAMQDGGQRVKTVLCYLNNPDENGGETIFPRLSKSICGKQGQLIVFDNTDPNANPLPMSLHQGAAILAGEKWIYSKWLRQNVTSYKENLVKLHL